MDVLACKKCGSLNLGMKEQGTQTALECNDCGTWQKWIGKEDGRLTELRIAEYSKPNIQEKSLNISEVNGARTNISDIEIYGDVDVFALLCKASSKSQGWMKSTKVCNVVDGCIVQVTTQQKNLDGTYSLAEALTYVPEMRIDTNANPRKLVPIKAGRV